MEKERWTILIESCPHKQYWYYPLIGEKVFACKGPSGWQVRQDDLTKDQQKRASTLFSYSLGVVDLCDVRISIPPQKELRDCVRDLTYELNKIGEVETN